MKALKILALSLAGLVAAYVLTFGTLYVCGFRMYRVPTAGMTPTVKKNELVFGRLSESYKNHIQRFDIAIFTVPKWPDRLMVKRVIGLPGERVGIDEVGVRINNKLLRMPRSASGLGLGLKKCDILIPSDGIFVLGDFTQDSYDSRYFGPLSKNDVLGYLVFKK